MSLTRELLEAASSRVTRQIGARWGESFPFYYVCEFPKSGGTWLGQMMADCLQVPFPKRPAAPLAMACVVHAHWRYDSRLRRVVYMHRDGRDVMVSYYFHFLRRAWDRSRRRDQELVRTFRRLFGPDADLNDTHANLPRFIEHVHKHPIGSRVSWQSHVRSWRDRPNVVYTSYERLLENTGGELSRVLAELLGEPPAGWRIELVVEKYSMHRQTGRAPGQENRGSFIRKGVAGDWRNHFSREARELFHDLAGDALIALGYERDGRWIARDAASVQPERATAGPASNGAPPVAVQTPARQRVRA